MRIRAKQNAISQVCKDLDVSRDELARRLNVASTTAYRIEMGRTDPSPKFIAALMRATGLSFEELFEIVDDEAA